MECTGQHSGCNLSFTLQHIGIVRKCVLAGVPRKEAKDLTGLRTDSFFPVNRQGAGCWSSLRLLMIISIVMLKE